MLLTSRSRSGLEKLIVAKFFKVFRAFMHHKPNVVVAWLTVRLLFGRSSVQMSARRPTSLGEVFAVVLSPSSEFRNFIIN
jgi:hypothetical protein